MKKTVAFGLGSNLGNRYAYLLQAGQLLNEHLNTEVHASRVYSTPPWGNTEQPAFLNQILVVHTTASIFECLEVCRMIEDQLGRVRHEKWGPRSIDVDLLLYDSEVYRSEDLEVPHPRIAERSFVLTPLCDVIPEFIHPVHRLTLRDLQSRLPNNCTVFA